MQHIAANCPWCKSRWRLARGWFARLAADPEPRTEEPRWDSKRGGDIGNRHGGMIPPELLARNPLHCCPGSGSENPGIPEPRNPRTQESQNPGIPEPSNPKIQESQNPGIPEPSNPKIRGTRRAICLLEPLTTWPLGGVFSATKYVPLIPWGVLRKGFSPF